MRWEFWKVPPLKRGESGGEADVGKYYAHRVNADGHIVSKNYGPFETIEEGKEVLPA